MLKHLSLFFLILPSLSWAQPDGSLTIFSEKGDRFFLWLDGVQQNARPVSRLRIEKLPDLYYSAKIIFEDKKLWPVAKNNLYVSDADEISADVIYRLKKDAFNRQRLIFYSISPANENFRPLAGTTVMGYNSDTSARSVASVPVADSLVATSGKKLGSLHVFSANNDKFFLYLNDVKQNTEAQASVRISEIPGLYYNARIEFGNSSLPLIIKNSLSVSDGEDVLMDASYRIRKDKSGRPRLNFYSMKSPQDSFIPLPGMYVYNFGNPDVETVAVTTVPERKKVAPATGTITDIRISEPSSALKKQARAFSERTSDKAKATTLATTKSIKKQAEIHASEPVPTNAVKSEPKSVLKKCNGWPLGKGDLMTAKKAIQDAGRDISKLKVAEERVRNNCLSTDQIIGFCQLFDSEKTKLAFAKYAYQFTLDRKNYSDLLKLFTQQKNKKDLSTFISGQ